MSNKPTTIEQIKQSIEHCKTRIQLEQMSISALERDLQHLESEQAKDKLLKIAKGKIIKHALTQK
jgi:hypothetical protein